MRVCMHACMCMHAEHVCVYKGGGENLVTKKIYDVAFARKLAQGLSLRGQPSHQCQALLALCTSPDHGSVCACPPPPRSKRVSAAGGSIDLIGGCCTMCVCACARAFLL